MKKIESFTNPRIKKVKKVIAGKGKTDYVIEGKRLFNEALESGVEILDVFVTQATLDHVVFKRSKGVEVFVVPETLMAQISTLEAPPGILAIARRKAAAEPVLESGFAAFAWSIRDPGNLGTIIRSAEATGCHFVACSPDCADPYSSKVLRASMGSLFRVPVFRVFNPEEYLIELRKKRIQLCGLVPRGGSDLFKSTLPEPAILILGGETMGFPEAMNLDATFSIPMAGKAESLNVGVAASIAFYHCMKVLQKE